MKNLEALKAQCKLICNTCYVDDDVARLVLQNAGLDAESEPSANDPDIVRAAILIVKGWIETSRSENGISASVELASVRKNIAFWCGMAGLDASEYVDDLVVIENGSNMW
ncbi:MAG: hypothetical protein IKU16_09455 [Muribaculaceae bacterium]|nr:hypothetical protein [Muribaculaceae bacterium]MBR4887477.1 hypothetical protein [Muribaculaceae bacterium]